MSITCAALSARETAFLSRTPHRLLTVQPNAIDALQLRDLERALGKLAPEQHQVILLVGLEGMRYEEVAEIRTVRSRLSRGRDQLRILMGMEDKNLRPPVANADRPEKDQRAA
jgi:RNA polymerase sigma-70 factor (ECF subfamily)